MLQHPRDVPAARERDFRREIASSERRIREALPALEESIESSTLRAQFDNVLFGQNQLLPKRSPSRPGEGAKSLGVLVDALYDEFQPDGIPRERILALSTLVVEYYDVVDDIVDGDVIQGGESEAVATLQAALPLFVRQLASAPPDVIEYWTREATWLSEVFLVELSTEPTADRYEALVDRQAIGFSMMTGLVAIAADADPTAVNRAEQLGSLCFKYSQFMLDGVQYRPDEDEGWNAFELLSHQTAISRMQAWQKAFERALEEFSDDCTATLKPLLAIDLSEWKRQSVEPDAA